VDGWTRLFMFKLRSESTKSSCQRPKTFAGACKEAVKQLKTIPSDGEYGFVRRSDQLRKSIIWS